MSRFKAKSNYKISFPEAILNLSNINYKNIYSEVAFTRIV